MLRESTSNSCSGTESFEGEQAANTLTALPNQRKDNVEENVLSNPFATIGIEQLGGNQLTTLYREA